MGAGQMRNISGVMSVLPETRPIEDRFAFQADASKLLLLFI